LIKLDTQFRIGGRRVSQQSFRNGIEQEVRRIARDEVESRARSVRCPVHGQTANLRFQSAAGDQLRWSVEGCCQDLVDRVHQALS